MNGIQICGSMRPYVNPDILSKEHQRILQDSIEYYKKIPKIGEQQFSQSYLNDLTDQIHKEYKVIIKKNENKGRKLLTSFQPMTILFIVLFIIIAIQATGIIKLLLHHIFSSEYLLILVFVLALILVLTYSY